MFGFVKKSPSNRNLRGGGGEAPAAAGSDDASSVAAGGAPSSSSAAGGGPSLARFRSAAFALLLAAERGDSAEVARLLTRRAGAASSVVVQVNDRDELGRTALHVAAIHGHLPLARALVETHGAELDAVTKALSAPLLAEDDDSEKQSALGRKTPLCMAIQARRYEVAHYLLTQGASVSAVSADAPATTALHLAARFIPIDRDSARTFADMAGTILVLLGSANQQDELGNTALHYAAERGYLPLVTLLLKHQADTTITNKNGNTSLLLAIKEGKREVALVIMNSKAEPSLEFLKNVPSCTRESEIHQQRGWLRKRMQAADKPKIIKKWQKRYVELRQSSLVYFKNQQQATPSYEVDLKTATVLVPQPYNRLFEGVEEFPVESNHPYLFVIRPLPKEEKRSTSDHNTEASKPKLLLLSAATEEELQQWVESILAARRLVQIPERNSIDPKHDFKVTLVLKQLSKYFNAEKKSGTEKDSLLEDSTEATIKEDEAETAEEDRRNSLIPIYAPELWNPAKANPRDVQALRTAFFNMRGLKETAFDYRPVTNPHSIFQFMVSILKKLSTPLLTFKLGPMFLSAADAVDPSKRLEQYRTLMRNPSLPTECMQKIRVLLPILRRLEANHARNGMTMGRLTDIFTPIFVCDRIEKTSQETIRERHLAHIMLEDFVRHQERLFAEKPEEGKDALATYLEGEYSHLHRRVGSQGLLYLLDQEVEALRMRWEEVTGIGRGESESRIQEWEKTLRSASTLGEAIQAEMNASESMIIRMHTSLAELGAAIDAMQPHWEVRAH